MTLGRQIVMSTCSEVNTFIIMHLKYKIVYTKTLRVHDPLRACVECVRA